jgi:hypothetical protein
MPAPQKKQYSLNFIYNTVNVKNSDRSNSGGTGTPEISGAALSDRQGRAHWA